MTTAHSAHFSLRLPWADIRTDSAGYLSGRYTQDLDTIREGDRIGLFNARTCVAAYGRVREAAHDAGGHRITFDTKDFGVLVGGEPLMVSADKWAWRSARGAAYVHAVTGVTMLPPFPATQRYEPVPGRSIAFVDMTGDGSPGQEWRFGTPFHSYAGELKPWCLHCGTALPDPSTTHAPLPLADAPGAGPACRDGLDHQAVKIWTPHGWACEDPPQNLALTNDLRERDGLRPLDPFDVDRMADAIRYYLSDAEEWWECGMFDLPSFVPPEVYRCYAGAERPDAE